MNAADQKIDRLADTLQQLADHSAAEGGIKAKLAQPLAEDAEFLRKLKPSLIKARMKGEAPTNERPSRRPVASAPRPSRPPKPKRKKEKKAGGGGPNPWVVAGACLVAGVAVAKWLDWRGHAHPRG